jgi:hypothetical protein
MAINPVSSTAATMSSSIYSSPTTKEVIDQKLKESDSPTPIPTKGSLDEANWQQFLKNSTVKMDGVNANEAQVIFLGNIHTEKWQKAWRGALIDHYASDKHNMDIVLCEAVKAFDAFAPQSASFVSTKKVYCYGWDDMVVYKDNSSIDCIVQLNAKYKECQPSSKWSKEDVDLWQKAFKKNDKDCRHRTISMIKTAQTVLTKFLKPGQKLFVIAGSDHLFRKSTGYNVLDCFKGYKVALLLPKAVAPETDEMHMEYAKKLLSHSSSI